jgi:hypothetical protein
MGGYIRINESYRNMMGDCFLNSSVSGEKAVIDLCQHGNKLSSSIKGEFLE